MNAKLRAKAAKRAGVFTRADAIGCGVSDEVLSRLVRTGLVLRLRHGVFVEAATMPADDPAARHALDVAAAMATTGRSVVASHDSAVLLHGGDLLEQPSTVRLTSDRGAPRSDTHSRIDVAAIPADHVHTKKVHGLSVMTAARAVIDLSRSQGVRAGVVAADSLLRQGKTNRRRLESILRDCSGWPGSLDACRAVRLADKRSESALEAVSRVVMDDHGIEMPESQVWIELTKHPPVRADFYWKKHRLIGEADGKVKYDLARDPDALYKERIRHEWLEDDEYNVVRWRWVHVEGDGSALAERLERAIRKAHRRMSWAAGAS